MNKQDRPDVPKKLEEIAPAIQALIDGVADPEVAYGVNTDGYGKCVEAMWRAAYIAHEYVAAQLGVSGFQHSVSSLTIVGALRGYDGPFMVINGRDALYPQYDLVGKVADWMGSDDFREYIAKRAAELIAEAESREPIKLEDGSTLAPVAGRVREHWNAIVAAEAERTSLNTPREEADRAR